MGNVFVKAGMLQARILEWVFPSPPADLYHLSQQGSPKFNS